MANRREYSEWIVGSVYDEMVRCRVEMSPESGIRLISAAIRLGDAITVASMYRRFCDISGFEEVLKEKEEEDQEFGKMMKIVRMFESID